MFIVIQVVEFKSFNELLDSRLTEVAIQEVESSLEKTKRKEIEKTERIIESQQGTIKKLEKKELEEREKAESTYNNYQLINDLLQQISTARKRFSFFFYGDFCSFLLEKGFYSQYSPFWEIIFR